MIAIRTLARYLAPVALLTLLVFGPLLALALRIKVPLNAPQARELLRVAWMMGALALVGTLGFAGAMAPLVRSVAAGAPLAQHHALGASVVGLVRAVLPTLVAVLGIVLGLLALVVPGLVLLPLFSLVAASPAAGIRARLADSVAAARAQLVPTTIVVAIAVALVVGLILVPQLGLTLPLPKKPGPAQLVPFAQLVRRTVFGLVLAAPILATLLAMVHTTAARRDVSA